MVNNLPSVRETHVQSLGGEDPLEKEMAIYSSFLTWRIPRARGAWRATAHGVAKESDMTWQINHHKDQLVVAEHTNPLPLSF